MARHAALIKESLSAARMGTTKGLLPRVATQVDAQDCGPRESLFAGVADVAFPGVKNGGDYLLVFCCWWCRRCRSGNGRSRSNNGSGSKVFNCRRVQSYTESGRVQELTCAELWLEMEERSAVTGIWDFW